MAFLSFFQRDTLEKREKCKLNEKSWNIFEMYFSVIWVLEVVQITYLVTPLWKMFSSFWPKWWIYGSYLMFFGAFSQKCSALQMTLFEFVEQCWPRHKENIKLQTFLKMKAWCQQVAQHFIISDMTPCVQTESCQSPQLYLTAEWGQAFDFRFSSYNMSYFQTSGMKTSKSTSRSLFDYLCLFVSADFS